jgi:hypothetical protein
MATDFTLIELDAIHAAFSEALASAKEREERMPSAAALNERAANILRVRNEILATMPQSVRRNYPRISNKAGRVIS